ncbi:hypothetical protein D3C84_1086200 [compost metagenome]
MAEVTQGIAGAFEGIFGVTKQVVNLRNQRVQLLRHPVVQLTALALLQLGDLLANVFQWAQRPAHGDALQGEDQQQPRRAQG